MLMGGGMEGGVMEGEGVVGGKGVWRRWRRVWLVVVVWTFVFFRGNGGGNGGDVKMG